MLGDEIPSAATTNGPTGASALQNNQDLLAEIFGSSSTSSAPTPGPSAPAPKSTVDDILGLFDSTPAAPVGAASLTQTALPTSPPMQAAATAFALPQTETASPQPAAPRLTAYPAYDKNELRISLTPQTSPQRPGVVNILARFQVTGSTPATALNFQAAVPKVSYYAVLYRLSLLLTLMCAVSTATNASDVQP